MMKPTEDIEMLMLQMNASAHSVASEFQTTLDYADDSVKAVESILGELHNEYVKSEDDTGLCGIALFFAAYIGEVIRRKGQGGTWCRDHATIGEDTFPFHWNGGVLFPYGWCLKRIFDGSDDNVWLKFQYCVLNAATNGRGGGG